MSLKGIATQAEIAPFQTALEQLAANLRFHVNETPIAGTPLGSSLSLAHGIDLVEGYIDAYGNDLREYRDSVGDLVSDPYTSGKANFVRFVVNGQPYYAPVQTTTEPGQDSSLGLLSSADRASTGPGSCALVTDYITLEEQTAVNLDTLFLEHTRVAAQNAHIPLTVTPSVTKDSAGHTIGTHLIRMQFGGIVYHVPVANRLGGPAQPPRIVLSSYYLFDDRSGNGSFQDNYGTYSVTATVAGTGPFTFTWYGRVYSNIGVIVDPSDGQVLPEGTHAYNGLNTYDTNIYYSIASTATTSKFTMLGTTTNNNYANLKVWYYPKVTALATGLVYASTPFVYNSVEDT